jgi:hypothetical protein
VKKSVLKYNIWYTKKQTIQYSVFSVAKLFRFILIDNEPVELNLITHAMTQKPPPS